MIKYLCKKCGEIDKKQRDRNTNKCLRCKYKLEQLETEANSSKDINIRKQLTKERKKFEQSYVKTVSEIYWCNNHNTPIYDRVCSLCIEENKKHSTKYLSTDVRPVFYEERILLSALINDETLINSSVWYTANNKYYVNGRSLNYNKSDLMKKNPDKIRKKIVSLKEKYYKLIEKDFKNDIFIKNFIKANKKRLNEIDSDAIEFIKKVSKNYRDNQIFISFSGGKDSTVVHDLVLRALAGRKIIRLFGDTTLEYQDTYQYIKRLKNKTNYLPMLTTKNRKDNFYELCKVIGPPSRVIRWCCTFFKTGPISDRLDRIFKNEKRILAFQGIRRSESISRSKYEMESESSKIAKQKVVSPIIDWFDFDIWLYILSKDIDFNEAYKKGFARVGCWCCPNNSEWSDFLSKIYLPSESQKFRQILMDFAIETNKKDPETYVDEGFWKARQGGNGLNISNNNIMYFTSCVNEETTFNYELTRPISDQFYELFKPFGYLDKSTGNKRLGEVYIIDENMSPILKIQGRRGKHKVKITVINIEYFREKFGTSKIKNIQDIKKKIENQITKFQLCIGCSGCTSICKFDAIKISKEENQINEAINSDKKTNELIKNTKYVIDENKCIKCTKCVDHFENGCYMSKVLRTKRSD